MIELFSIFGRGGIVLWCFQEGSNLFAQSVNALIHEVFMQERGNSSVFKHDNRVLRFKLDNEFELIFLVVYHEMVQLSYADKLLSDVELRFRDMYKNILVDTRAVYEAASARRFALFNEHFKRILVENVQAAKAAPKPAMRTFNESEKSKKTVASLIERPGEHATAKSATAQQGKDEGATKAQATAKASEKKQPASPSSIPVAQPAASPRKTAESAVVSDGDDDAAAVQRRLNELMKKKSGGAGAKKDSKPSKVGVSEKKGKQNRKWELCGNDGDAKELDYSAPVTANGGEQVDNVQVQHELVGQMVGELRGLDEDQEDVQIVDESDEEEEVQTSKSRDSHASAPSGGGGRSWFSAFKSLVGSKKLTGDDVRPALEKMRDHLIGKNVAAEPAEKLCQSVATKLEGSVIGTLSGVASTVREAVRESLVQILSPKHRVDILRDIVEAKSQRRPYVIVFCGVNGVGKSTNLAKITFWLNENGHRVLIAAGDTFRAGAVEQLRTHTKHLNALHPNSVQLYEQGYGKDPAGLAAQAVAIAAERVIDVVLVDTAGRMQDNEPLMRALAKLIKVNEPDLVLFVGEALVGNEAVDQLVKFNQALADHTAPGVKPRLIDGIVLTKFDTVDDKVGAAISMTYITGQPIVFVGTGQTYADLKNLNVNAVVNSLMK